MCFCHGHAPRALGRFLRANPAAPTNTAIPGARFIHPVSPPSSPTSSSSSTPSSRSPRFNRIRRLFPSFQGRTAPFQLTGVPSTDPSLPFVGPSLLPTPRSVDGRYRRRCNRAAGDGVPGDQRRPGVRCRRGRRHGGRPCGPPARHAPHPPPATAAARQPRDRRDAAPPALRRAHAPRHPPRRGALRALPRHGRAARVRRIPECHGVPSLRDPVTVARFRELHLRSSFLYERGSRRRRHGGAANAHPVPRRARQDQAAAGGGGAQTPAPGRPPRPGRHGPGHPPQRRAPRHLPWPHGDRAPRRAGARRLLLDVRVRPGAAAPGLPARRRREPGHDARVRWTRRRRQLGLLLPAGRGEVAAAGGREVPGSRGLLPEERQGGRAPRAVARPGNGRGQGVRRQWRHLLGVRAGSAILGQRRRAEDGHGGELN